MLAFPNAKINLGLHVTGKRDDGYHNIETVLFPIPFFDALEIVPVPDGPSRLFETGIPVPSSSKPNLCLQAYDLLHETHRLPPVHIHLHKRIPTGSGLGGGSSDAAFALNVLNSLFQLKINTEKRMSLAAQLGSDCPFFIQDKPMLATGRGELLSPIDIPQLKGTLVLVIPPVQISTAIAYQKIIPRNPLQPIRSTLARPLHEWNGRLTNDFEAFAFERFPLIRSVRDKLLETGATYAAMSGSGSSVFGIFRQPPPDKFHETFPGCTLAGPFTL